MSRNPVRGATTKDMYDEEFVINTITEHAELTAKFGSLFGNQSQNERETTEAKEYIRIRNEREMNQS